MPESASTASIGARDKARPVHKDLTKSNDFDGDRLLALTGQLEQAEAKKAETGKEISSIKKTIEAMGVHLGVYDMVRQDVAESSTAAAKARMRQYISISRVFQSPIGYQIDMFDEPRGPDGVNKADVLEVAKEEGRVLGLLGKNPDHQKYAINSETGQAHQAGWNEGQDVRKQQFMAVNKENAEAERIRKAAVADKAKRKAQKAAEKAKAKTSEKVVSLKDAKAKKEAERTARKASIPKRPKKK